MTPTAHSKIGIAACVGGVGMFLVYLAALLLYRVGMSADQEPPWASPSLGVLVMGVLLFVPIPVHVIGLVMGSVSLFFPKRAKLFPLLAIALNGVFGFLSLFPWLYVLWLGLHTGVK
jgi:hypothetical protein